MHGIETVATAQGEADLRGALAVAGDEGERSNLYGLMAEYERRLILLALQAASGHQRRAAATLGILPSTLSEKLRRLGLRPKARVRRHERPLAPGRVLATADLESALT